MIADAARRHVTLEKVRTMVLDALAGVDAQAYLFGSQARGDVWTLSDIDVAIDHAEPLPVGLLARLREALEESTIPVKVDVVDLAEVDDEFRASVLAEGKRWTASAKG